MKNCAPLLFATCCHCHRWVRLSTTVGLIVLVIGCLSRQHVTYQEMAQLASTDVPQSLAVLPFKNTTSQPDLGPFVRTGLYAHLSYRRFRDVELAVVDRVLTEHGLGVDAQWTAEQIRTLGDWLGCDAVVIGSVDQFERIYAGVYAQLNIGAHVSVHATRTGKKIWSDTHVARLHEGDIPLTPLGLPFSGIRTGLKLHDREIVAVVDLLTRHLAERIPGGHGRHDQDKGGYRYDLQIGAYLDHQRALEKRDLLLAKGYPASVRSETTPDAIWHRVVVGPYQDEEEAITAQAALESLLSTRPMIRREPL